MSTEQQQAIDLEETLRVARRADQDGDIEKLEECLKAYYSARADGAEEPRNGDVRADTLCDTLYLGET